MVLADFVRLPKAAQVADLGSGGGVLGLLLCGRYSDCTVTGVELCQQAHQAALENIDRNGLGRLRSVLGDLRQVRTILPGGAFSCAVSNPPYFSGGLPSSGVAGSQARQESSGPSMELGAQATAAGAPQARFLGQLGPAAVP